MRLPDNWDMYGGRPLHPEIAAFTVQLLAEVLPAETDLPEISPTSDGGLVLEWERADVDVVLTIRPNYTEVYITQSDGAAFESILDGNAYLHLVEAFDGAADA